MKRPLTIILVSLFFTSCDCVQQASGVVLDRQTKKALEKVSLEKDEKEDVDNPYSRKRVTDSAGGFDYHSISGGRGCPDLVLYFNKPGYKTTKITFASYTTNDTVFLDKLPFNRDASIRISKADFDQLVDECILLLQTKQLIKIKDEEHIQIMMCLNTIGMTTFKGENFDHLVKLSKEKKYTEDIIKIYKEWSPNRGMGFYFKKLKMELYGTPSPYAVYTVTE